MDRTTSMEDLLTKTKVPTYKMDPGEKIVKKEKKKEVKTRKKCIFGGEKTAKNVLPGESG